MQNNSSSLSPSAAATSTTSLNPQCGRCGGSLLQCTLVFSSSPHPFPSDQYKISCMIRPFCGNALQWVEAWFKNYPNFGCTFQDFVMELQQIYDYCSGNTELSKKTWKTRTV
ncbi:hypothetical protein ILYODFUR_028674 [Ilyodon furcidens]|uniref:DUF4939 domain-containing protein n=1 Tax=Ilyodon furcidens TaxID=33524 RepID=A0ABV0ST43_9TELE